MADVVESVVLPVRPGQELQFEAAFRHASTLISRQPGYITHSLRRGVEQVSTYLLTVVWDSVEAHEDGFRKSADYQEWRNLLHRFYDPFPVVLHYGPDLMSEVAQFWGRCRGSVPGLPEAMPEAWAFGATVEHADELLALVTEGVKTGTASSLWDLEATGEPMPQPGDFSIILDGRDQPRAVIETTAVAVVPFDQVDAEHAASEGEGDRTLAAWRDIHERFWREHSENARGYNPDMPVVCERFRLIYAE